MTGSTDSRGTDVLIALRIHLYHIHLVLRLVDDHIDKILRRAKNGCDDIQLVLIMP